jgi:hypothetical protein
MGVLTDARKQHLYQTCQDEDCQRFACSGRRGRGGGHRRCLLDGGRGRGGAGPARGHGERLTP